MSRSAAFTPPSASSLAIRASRSSRDRSIAKSLIGNLLGFQVVLSALTLALCLGIGSLLFDDVTWVAVVVLSFDLVLNTVSVDYLTRPAEVFAEVSHASPPSRWCRG